MQVGPKEVTSISFQKHAKKKVKFNEKSKLFIYLNVNRVPIIHYE